MSQTKAENKKYQAVERLCELKHLPAPVRELRFAAPDRQWRFDFCWPDILLALEVEGGIFESHGGSHRNIGKFLKDMEKYNAAALQGWKLLRFKPGDIDNGKFLGYLIEFFRHHGTEETKLEIANAAASDRRKRSPF